jgi:hypothetical protein
MMARTCLCFFSFATCFSACATWKTASGSGQHQSASATGGAHGHPGGQSADPPLRPATALSGLAIGIHATEKLLVEEMDGHVYIHPTGDVGVWIAVPIDGIPALIAGVYRALGGERDVTADNVIPFCKPEAK